MLWGKIDLGSYQNLKAYQRINHFPGTWQVRDAAADLLWKALRALHRPRQLGRKDNLARSCQRQRAFVGAVRLI